MLDKCQCQPAQNADHPRWEIRAENVDRRGMMAGDADRNEEQKDKSESESYKIENYSFGSHLSTRMTARGELSIDLTIGIKGRAKSPTLSARAA